MDERLDEILHRLRDLDDRLSRLEREHHGGDHRWHDDRYRSRDRHRDRHDDGFDEKRVIDTIVRLVGEVVARELDRREPRR